MMFVRNRIKETQSMNRRNFLNILGGGTILAAASSAGFLFSRTPTMALEPWKSATTYTDPIQRALSHALLAPNPHNRQPWLVNLSQEGQVTIHRDTTRDLPMTDPFNRQIFIGMGCFLETLKISATETGHSVEFDILPQGENGPIAVAKFSKVATLDPLAQFITTRHSDKEAYSDRIIEEDKISELSNHVAIIADQERVEALRQITWDALEIEMLTPRTLKESVDLMRIGKREINANPDGIEMREPMLDALYNVGLLTRETLLNTDHSGSAPK
jgi:predicted transcriptional regulator